MISKSIVIKLHGINKVMEQTLAEKNQRVGILRRYWNIQEYTFLFDIFAEVLSELKKIMPDVFNSIAVPTIAIPDEQSYFRHDIESLHERVNTVLEMIKVHDFMTEPAEPSITNEGIFFAGQSFDALRYLQQILDAAKASIWLIDRYADETTLEILSGKPSGCAFRLLTNNNRPSFVVACKRFEAQYGGLEVRQNNNFHDRFMCIDNNHYYHLGASIDKHLGRRTLMFSLIEEPRIINDLKIEFEKQWADSPPLF